MDKYCARNICILESAFSPLRRVLSPHFLINILAEAHSFEFCPSPPLTTSTNFHFLRFLLHCLAENGTVTSSWREIAQLIGLPEVLS